MKTGLNIFAPGNVLKGVTAALAMGANARVLKDKVDTGASSEVQTSKPQIGPDVGSVDVYPVASAEGDVTVGQGAVRNLLTLDSVLSQTVTAGTTQTFALGEISRSTDGRKIFASGVAVNPTGDTTTEEVIFGRKNGALSNSIYVANYVRLPGGTTIKKIRFDESIPNQATFKKGDFLTGGVTVEGFKAGKDQIVLEDYNLNELKGHTEGAEKTDRDTENGKKKIFVVTTNEGVPIISVEYLGKEPIIGDKTDSDIMTTGTGEVGGGIGISGGDHGLPGFAINGK